MAFVMTVILIYVGDIFIVFSFDGLPEFRGPVNFNSAVLARSPSSVVIHSILG